MATLNAIEPNEGHRFFLWLTKGLGKSVTVITQNVDGHETKAGNQKVIEMHGNIHVCYCPACNKNYSMDKVLKKGHVPSCECQFVLRPNVVFFGDAAHNFDRAEKEVDAADLLLVVGTSLEVSPFNQLSNGRNGKKVVLLKNPDVPWSQHNLIKRLVSFFQFANNSAVPWSQHDLIKRLVSFFQFA